MRTTQNPQTDTAHIMYGLLKNAQRRFGLARFEIGVLLEHIKETEAWRGKARSFPEFLEEERINSSAAFQYTRVARKLFYELKLSDAESEMIATCNMRILDLACQVINADNRTEVLSLLSALGERDAKQSLLEMQDDLVIASTRKPRRNQAANVLEKYWQLPEDQRIEFAHTMSKRSTPKEANGRMTPPSR